MSPPTRSTIVVLAIALTALLPAVAFIGLHLAGPFDGAILDTTGHAWTREGVIVMALDDRPGGLRDGDTVVAAAGRSLETWARDLFRPTRWHAALRPGERTMYVVARDGQHQQLTIDLGDYSIVNVVRRHWGVVLFAIVFQIVAAFVFLKRRSEPAAAALMLIAAGAFGSTVGWTGPQISDITNGLGFWLSQWLLRVAYFIWLSALVHFTLVFPRPRSVVRQHPLLIPAIYLVPIILEFCWIAGSRLTATSTLEWIGRWDLAGTVPAAIFLVVSLVSLITGVRTAGDPISRRQIRWVAYALGLVIVLTLGFWQVPTVLRGRAFFDWNHLSAISLIVPISIAIAILRYRLFAIDVIISRTLIWGALTAFVIGGYGLVIGVVSEALDVRGNLGPSLIATIFVALLFQPLRERVQDVVNRLVYGDRHHPYAVVSRLGQRLETTLAPDAVLPTIAETVAQALKLPYVAITLPQEEAPPVHVAHGVPHGDLLTLPLIYQSERVGEMALAARGPGDSFSTADRRLLDDLARQIGIAAHAVRLTEDLQQSRQRIVTAREEERRRLRRDLHDGLGPSLASITLKLDAARNLLSRDPAAVDTILTELKTQTQAAISDVRRVVYDLRPPALDEMGLVATLREHAARIQGDGLRIDVQAPNDLPPLTAAVEVAAYRIVLEAMTNVVRHAAARICTIRLSVTDALIIDVIDDGRGLPTGVRMGVGLSAMRERAAELGGRFTIDSPPSVGFHLQVRLPIPRQANGADHG